LPAPPSKALRAYHLQSKSTAQQVCLRLVSTLTTAPGVTNFGSFIYFSPYFSPLRTLSYRAAFPPRPTLPYHACSLARMSENGDVGAAAEGGDEGAREVRRRAGVHMGTSHVSLNFQQSGYVNTMIMKEESTRRKFHENKYTYTSSGLSYLGEESKRGSSTQYLVPFAGDCEGYPTDRASAGSDPAGYESKLVLLAINDLKLKKEFLKQQLRLSSVSISKNSHLREMALSKVDDQAYQKGMEDVKKLYNSYKHKPPPKFT